MSLDLDPRQRAMLQEMGVQVWWPAAAPALTAAPAAPSLPPAGTPPAMAPRHPAGSPPRTAPLAQQVAPARAAAPPRPPAASPAPAGAGDAAAAAAAAALPWTLRAPQQLFAQANPAHTPANLGTSWLLVAEDAGSSDPLAGEAGRLLYNMLQALRLHRHPQVFFCALQAPGSTDPAPVANAAPCADALASAVAAVQPSVVLVMGRIAARTVLGRSEPLGQLRATPHTVSGVPAVVTYDALYLLRAPPATKALVWADLCRARALAAGDDATTAH